MLWLLECLFPVPYRCLGKFEFHLLLFRRWFDARQVFKSLSLPELQQVIGKNSCYIVNGRNPFSSLFFEGISSFFADFYFMKVPIRHFPFILFISLTNKQWAFLESETQYKIVKSVTTGMRGKLFHWKKIDDFVEWD